MANVRTHANKPNAETLTRVVLGLRGLDLTKQKVWKNFEDLSQDTRFESLDVFPDEVIVSESGKNFTAHVNVYISLGFGRSGTEGGRYSEGLPGLIKGRIQSDGIVVDKVDIDTSVLDV
jgi:hypothetical protein